MKKNMHREPMSRRRPRGSNPSLSLGSCLRKLFYYHVRCIQASTNKLFWSSKSGLELQILRSCWCYSYLLTFQLTEYDVQSSFALNRQDQKLTIQLVLSFQCCFIALEFHKQLALFCVSPV